MIFQMRVEDRAFHVDPMIAPETSPIESQG
jgi:hypothetical protein